MQGLLDQQLQGIAEQIQIGDQVRQALEDTPKYIPGTPEGDRLAGERIRLWNQARELRRQGEFAEAIELANRALAIDRDLGGKRSPAAIEKLRWIAAAEIEAGDLPAARLALAEVLDVVTSRFGKDDWRTVDALLDLNELDQLAQLNAEARARWLEAQAAEQLVSELVLEGRMAEALAALEQAGAVYRELLPDPRRRQAQVLEQAGRIYRRQGDAAQAEELLRAALEQYEQTVGDDHPRIASCVLELGHVLFDRGDQEGVQALFERALTIAQQTLGENSWPYALAAEQLAHLAERHGDAGEALRLLRLALAVCKQEVFATYYVEDLSGPDRWRSLASRQVENGYFTSANEITDAARIFGRLESLLRRQADDLLERRDYAAAGSLLDELALATAEYHGQESVPAIDARLAALRANSQAVLSPQERAEWEQAEKHLGEADVLQGLREYAAAIEPVENAYRIRRQLLGDEHPDTILCLARLGEAHRAAGQLRQAEPLLRQAVEAGEGVFGRRHPSQVSAQGSLESLYLAVGSPERVVNEEATPEWTPLVEAANAAAEAGQLAAARQRIDEACALAAEKIGSEDARYGDLLLVRALICFMQGEIQLGRQALDQSLSIAERNLAVAFTFQTQAQQLQAAAASRRRLAIALHVADEAGIAAEELYRHVLTLKGAVYVQQRRIRQARDNPAAQPLLSELAAVHSEMAALFHHTTSDELSGPWSTRIGELTEAKDRLERELSLLAAENAGTQPAVATAGELQRALPPGAALLDILQCDDFADGDRRAFDEPGRAYVAFVVRPDRAIERIELGPAKAIDAAVRAWRTSVAHDATEDDGSVLERLRRQIEKTQTGHSASDPAAQLRARVWEPLAQHLEGVSLLLYSPDGLLSLVPLAALPGDEPGSHLIEELAVVSVPVPSALAAAQDSADDPVGMLVVGDVDYGEPATAARSGRYAPLPGTEREISGIESLVAENRPSLPIVLLRGEDAVKNSVRPGMSGRQYVHLATHGFFSPPRAGDDLFSPYVPMMVDGEPGECVDPTTGELTSYRRPAPNPEYSRQLRRDRQRAAIEAIPELGSGIALAGANREAARDADGLVQADPGILHALEVADLDLRGTELVTISACQSGLGRVSSGEGVLGLQRAFQLAGARSTVSSLWRVDDWATQALIVEFYRNLVERKLGKLEALRQAQLAMLRQYDPRSHQLRPRGAVPVEEDASRDHSALSPYYWAPFVLSGDWR